MRGAQPTKQPLKEESGCRRFCFRSFSNLPRPRTGPRDRAYAQDVGRYALVTAMPINAEYRGPSDLPETIPVFPLPGALLLPRGQMPLNIFEQRYLAMVDDAFRDGHRLIGMIQPDVSHSPDEANPKLFRVGCVGRITQLAEAGDGRYILELTGFTPFQGGAETEGLTP